MARQMPVQKPHRSKQNYATDSNCVIAIMAFLGIQDFAHDFAADAHNTLAATFYDKETDALAQDRDSWLNMVADGWGWLNPEFTNIAPWAERCAQLKQDGGKVALLVPAGVGANWYRDHVNGIAYVLALNGRLCFINNWRTLKHQHNDPNGKFMKGDRVYPTKPLYPKDCILALYAPDFEPGFDVWSWQR